VCCGSLGRRYGKGKVLCAHLRTFACGGLEHSLQVEPCGAHGLPVDCALIAMGLRLRHPLFEQPPATWTWIYSSNQI
jgi:hypothetical protein